MRVFITSLLRDFRASRVAFRWVPACTLSLPAFAWAQTSPNPPTAPVPPEEVVQLSPFSVSADRQVGYQAESTLAGAGLRTPIENVGSAISVITPQFFADTGSTKMRDVLVYQAGMETAGLGGNFGG
ncbi:MAG TPA: hypothetical protein PLN52_07255, partial [Opitutaceae bacterium]|nr:hypothetical protein [Opitutaceae bacterium]